MAPTDAGAPAARIRARNRHHSWLVRVPILAWLAVVLLRYLRDPEATSLWSGLNLALHEIGHLLFAFLPPFWGVLGGTATELAIPVVVGILFLRRREDFGAAVALFWMATALLGAAVYAGDARLQALPLVSPFAGEPVHDWNYLLGRLGLLDRDRAVAAVLRGIGLGAMCASVLVGGWIVGLMATDPERAAREPAGPGAASLEAEGLRFRAWLEERDAERSHGAPGGSAPGKKGGPRPEADASPPPRRPPADADRSPPVPPVDHRALSAEERRFLEFLEREGDDEG